MGNNIKSNEEKPKIKEDDLIYEVAFAALNTDGVFAVAEKITKENLIMSRGKAAMRKGVKITGEREKIKIDVFLILEYGFKIPQIAWATQQNINKALQKLSANPVSAINIHINGIHF
ncbi:MAG: Asp23/Gls24 family envelope stress response protein [Eubacteriales bacterium]